MATAPIQELPAHVPASKAMRLAYFAREEVADCPQETLIPEMHRTLGPITYVTNIFPGDKPGWLVTAAAHSPQALVLARRAGADAALLSPVFPTASHPGAPALGLMRFASWCRCSPIAVYALGGITSQNSRRLQGTGAKGIAGIGGFVDKV